MGAAVEEQQEFRLDGLKWLLSLSIIAGAIYGNWYFTAQPLLYRVLVLLILAAIAALLAVSTRKGSSFLVLVKGARTEARKVVWPTRQERNQTTLIVVGVVFVMSLILWGLDTFFGWLVSLVIG